MDHQLNILGEFKNKDIENEFMSDEVRKNLDLIRYMILFSCLVFFLLGVPEYFIRKDINFTIITYAFFARMLIFILGVVFFFIIKRSKSITVIRILICTIASLIFAVYFCMAVYFAPVQIINPTFVVILLSTCLFLLPNRWIIDLCLSLLYSGLFIMFEPYICTTTSSEYVLVAVAYLCWNIVVISILFFSINKYKRNCFLKAIQLEDIANTDQLTKTHNRKSCDEIIETNCTGSIAFSVIMFDIDNFKAINDTYGHVAGDHVLVSITDLTRTMIRKKDIVARWGGEEFVIVMMDTSLKEAEELAKRLKEQLTHIEHKGMSQTITCSFGVTAYVEGDNVKSITKRADQLLYLAKEHGKNKVVAG